MIGLVFRILRVAKGYRGRIALAAVFSFLKAFCVKIPYVVAYFLFAGFLANTITAKYCWMCGGALVVSVAMQCVFQNLADRLQSASGFEIFAEQRIKLGEHLRKLPMGYFTEGNIGKISTVLATDMVFIEENLMMVIGDLMSYLFSAVLFVIMMFFFNPYLGIASLVVTLIMYIIGEAMKNSQIMHSLRKQYLILQRVWELLKPIIYLVISQKHFQIVLVNPAIKTLHLKSHMLHGQEQLI